MTVTTSWISKQEGRSGGDACVRDTRVTAWDLVEWKRLGLSDEQILESVQGLMPADLEAAWEYEATHRDEIDEAIRANNGTILPKS